MNPFKELNIRYDVLQHFESYALVEKAMLAIREELYRSPLPTRILVYVTLLRQTSLAMLVDGGPTFGCGLLLDSYHEMSAEEHSGHS